MIATKSVGNVDLIASGFVRKLSALSSTFDTVIGTTVIAFTISQLVTSSVFEDEIGIFSADDSWDNREREFEMRLELNRLFLKSGFALKMVI